MKFFFVIFGSLVLSSFTKQSLIDAKSSTEYFKVKENPFDSSQPVHILNNSSIKRLPGVIKDLSTALNQSTFKAKGLLNDHKLEIYLYDVYNKGFDTSAAVMYQPEENMYYLKLNSFNKKAADRALCATLIHELMHCILMDIDKNARKGDVKALGIVETFDSILGKKSFNSDGSFFMLMNTGEAGQHELIYRLFFGDMILLMKQFGSIHEEYFWGSKEPEYLLWSGLQRIKEYSELTYGERWKIETSIFRAKGLLAADE